MGDPAVEEEELCVEIGPEFKESGATADEWRNALSKVVQAVVVIRTTSCRTFDTELAGANTATGFVVDKKRGIILTNRHVVTPGMATMTLIHSTYRWCYGLPANRYGLYAFQWIVEVNGKPTPDLDAFAEVTNFKILLQFATKIDEVDIEFGPTNMLTTTMEIDDGEFVRVRTVCLTGQPHLLTLKQDLHYWPTWEVRRNPDTAMWQHKIIKCSSIDSSMDYQ